MTADVFAVLLLIAGLVVGALIGWFFAKSKFSSPLQFLETEKERLSLLVEEGKQVTSERDQLRNAQSALTAEVFQKKETLDSDAGFTGHTNRLQ